VCPDVFIGSRKVAILTSVLGTTPYLPDNVPVDEL
jgi:hypothetical protein